MNKSKVKAHIKTTGAEVDLGSDGSILFERVADGNVIVSIFDGAGRLPRNGTLSEEEFNTLRATLQKL